jgi:ubiquinone/menaquinone biosynthesis C-methylase UbiE
MKIEPIKPGIDPFYLAVMQDAVERGEIATTDRVLVACGGDLDRRTLLELGFTDVTISNLAPHAGHMDYAPYTWMHDDVEGLSHADNSFDLVLVHNGLHHCYNPMHALGEMCRVARKLIVCIEPQETWFTRLGARLGYGQMYEDVAVFCNGCIAGGVANTEIPNFVYRFSADAVRKFARCFFPWGLAPIRIRRTLRASMARFLMHRSSVLRWTFRIAVPVVTQLAKWIPAFNNCIAFTIQRPSVVDLHPWIRDTPSGPRVDAGYLKEKYSGKNST